MKLAQLLEMWKKFLAETAEKECNEEEFVDEKKDFQKDVADGYIEDRNEYLTTGPEPAGPAFPKKPKKTRAKSAPPSFGGS
jgi:hypothetical protein